MRTSTKLKDYISDFAKPLLGKMKDYKELEYELGKEGVEVRAKGQVIEGNETFYRTAFALENGNRYKSLMSIQNAIATKISNALARTMNESKNSDKPEEVKAGLENIKKSDVFKKQFEALTGTTDSVTGTFVVYRDSKMAEQQITNS